jgi:DNA polymerase III epsilon subunit-like protein
VTDREQICCSKQHTMREIVIDTETTGFDLLNGDRIVEIGAVVRQPAGHVFPLNRN